MKKYSESYNRIAKEEGLFGHDLKVTNNGGLCVKKIGRRPLFVEVDPS